MITFATRGTKAPETNVVDSENQQEDADAEKADNVMSSEIMNESTECSQT